MRDRRMALSKPCTNRWADLEPVDGGRFCGECRRVVVDLMHVTAREAFRRFDAAGGDLCVRIRPDVDGDAVFRPEPPRRRGVGVAVLAAALAGACGGERDGADDPATDVVTQPAGEERTTSADTRSDPARESGSAATAESGDERAAERPAAASDGTDTESADGEGAAEATAAESEEDAVEEGPAEHPAHPDEPHTPAHTRRHGLLGAPMVRPREPDFSDPTNPFGL